MINVPAPTRSPAATSNSITVPVYGAGISIVALSLSSIMIVSSVAIRSPGRTLISTIATSLKSPISGMWISLIIERGLQADTAEIGQHVPDETKEIRCRNAVHGTMVPGKGQGLDQARLKALPVPYRLDRGAGHAKDRNLGRVDDGREIRAP